MMAAKLLRLLSLVSYFIALNSLPCVAESLVYSGSLVDSKVMSESRWAWSATALGTQNIGSLSSEFNTFQSQFQLSSSFHSSSSQLDLQLDYVPQDSASQPYVHLPQAYYQFRGDYFDLSFGRRTYQWSQMDEIFNIGVWQPQYRRDFSRPKQEGFFGAFVGGENLHHKWQLFVTPLFLPDNGAKFYQQDGQIKSGNIWFSRPVSQIEFQHKQTQVYYELEMPELREVILNPSVAINYQVGDRNQGWSLSSSLAYKPMNQIHLEIASPEFMIQSTQSQVGVKIFPKAIYHTVTAMDLIHQGPQHRGFISIMYDRPVKNEIPEDWQQSPLYESRFFGGGLELFITSQTHFLIGGFARQDTYPPKQKKEIDADVESSFDRYPFTQAIQLQVKHKWKDRWLASAQSIVSTQDKGSLITLDLGYNLKANLDLLFQSTFVTSWAGDEDSKFFNKYRQNDTLALGARYVF